MRRREVFSHPEDGKQAGEWKNRGGGDGEEEAGKIGSRFGGAGVPSLVSGTREILLK